MLNCMTDPRIHSCALALCGLLQLACDGPTRPTVHLDSAFSLQVGETVALQGRATSVRFVEVAGDSRCPIDAVCVTGGDAVVTIGVRPRGSAETRHELHTGDLKPVRLGALTIALLRLEPDPFSSETIPPEEYRATLRVTE